jgi:hypothetical protein
MSNRLRLSVALALVALLGVISASSGVASTSGAGHRKNATNQIKIASSSPGSLPSGGSSKSPGSLRSGGSSKSPGSLPSRRSSKSPGTLPSRRSSS